MASATSTATVGAAPVRRRAAASIVLQFSNAGLLMLNQLLVLRRLGLAEYGDFQYGYAVLMAAPIIGTLGIYNLGVDPERRQGAAPAALMCSTVIAPLAVFFLGWKLALAAFLFPFSFVYSFAAMLGGHYLQRVLFGGLMLNVCILFWTITNRVHSGETLLLLATVTSLAPLFLLRPVLLQPARLRQRFADGWAVLASIHPKDIGVQAANGVLSQLTYLLPLTFARHQFPADLFGAMAFSLVLARTPFIVLTAISNVIAKPVLERRVGEVQQLSGVLSTISLFGMSVLVLNVDTILTVAGLGDPFRPVLTVGLLVFTGAVMWGSVDDVLWFSGHFAPDVLFRALNVLLTALVCGFVYWRNSSVIIFFGLLAASAVITYGGRFFYAHWRVMPMRFFLPPFVAVAGATLLAAYVVRPTVLMAASFALTVAGGLILWKLTSHARWDIVPAENPGDTA